MEGSRKKGEKEGKIVIAKKSDGLGGLTKKKQNG
jgi:hypothetical protein